MSKTIDTCSRCGDDFMYDQNDIHLFRDTKENLEMIKNYPVQDDTWASRRWNTKGTDYVDLSGGHDVICHRCDEIERTGKSDIVNHSDFT